MVKNKTAQFRFYEELNDFLPKSTRRKQFSYQFKGKSAIKDAIEAIGVPHTEVDLIVVNGESVGFEYHLKDDDIVAVYPVFESLDISPILRLRPRPLRNTRFILDVHLGKLARMLRMLGFDTLYEESYNDAEIVAHAVKDKRIIITRDQNLLKIKAVTHGYWLRSTDPMDQIIEVINRFDIKSQIKPFIRCMVCNGLIEEIDKTKIIKKVSAKTLKYYDVFFTCSSCGKIYWQGSHYKKMEKKIHAILYGSNV